MSKHFFGAAFALGLATVAWIGGSFFGSNGIALAMTAVIGGVYLLGAWELRQFRADSARLSAALEHPGPPALLA
jgi:hypothetical protein